MLAIDWHGISAFAQNFLHAAGIFLSSPTMQRLYVLMLGGLLLGLSAWWAYQQLAVLRDIQIEDFVLRIPGPKPKRPETIANQIATKAIHQKKIWQARFSALAQLLACGYFVPVMLLWLGAYYYNWFDQSNPPFLDLLTHTEVAQPAPSALSIFVVSQIAKGSLMDLFEVFNIDVGLVVNNPKAVPFSLGVLFFRTLMGAFTVGMIVFAWKAATIKYRLEQGQVR